MSNYNTEFENASIIYIPSVPCELMWLVVFKTGITISGILCDKDIESDESVKYGYKL